MNDRYNVLNKKEAGRALVANATSTEILVMLPVPSKNLHNIPLYM